jgi:putative Holliday junction resolvase
MRWMALDYGQKRIGVSWTDPLRMAAHPQPFIANTPEALDQIVALIQQQTVSLLIVGLPLTMKGTDSAMTMEARGFAQALSARTDVRIELYDERLTSSQAEAMLIQDNVSREKRKTLVDSLAATLLLEAYMREQEMGAL